MPLFAFGSNGNGQLGVGHRDDCHRPQRCRFDEQAGSTSALPRQVVGGGNHTLLVADDGQLFVTGANDAGQLGTSRIPEETAVDGGKDTCRVVFTPAHWSLPAAVTSVACGWTHSLVLTENGIVWSLGANGHGQCGRKDAANDPAPQAMDLPRVDTDTVITAAKTVALSAGLRSSCVVTFDARAYACGCNRGGQLGLLPAEAPASSAVQARKRDMRSSASSINALSPIPSVDAVAVACGQRHTAFVAQDRQSVRCFGDNRWHQLGQPTAANELQQGMITIDQLREDGTMDTATPTIVQIGAGWSHTVVLSSTGNVYAWGRGDRGQLGVRLDRNVQASADPIRVPLPAPARAIAVGSEHALALLHDGRCYAWGWNEHGNCGTGDTLDVHTPVLVCVPQEKAVDAVAVQPAPIRGIGCGYGTSFLWT
ncbi:regulator of chromosome condensation 1/beta-lactamase-inhibitor protein II [Thamnocephalis sphaerospora]|uniref:Regulator of chromosome condensation 1/beta-lactamase-inhibitor protein II n=1 Tax=Thamnocephalis sphaerospora TaxID=78915 RepID=A0A4P9XXQ9_9FUNG|nr:regulator of chromosome condensation 1/beta-lactamase-inhibitor protein II [Thamnocephalis sphaerospora]|eukprot:RKP11185.1 regulator of chromosome condensation 1/beta-lactamase-inhibitor protein II [Thamnocephalis sphaerospora]